ncbi:microspherule protein 1-like [Dendronephthya gigantea]|uniref:microspherule protein 1-like n=1 Tax=Dendronephthya gigantea TaxID=151771 RepID=UPI00106A4BF0|nr:microspherule protein 1-like [Dendronephthya gigantea]
MNPVSHEKSRPTVKMENIDFLPKPSAEEASKEPLSAGNVRNIQGFTNKSAIALSHLKGVHFGKSSGRSTPRRSSSRSIKRKKFDDELVESSLKNPGKPLGMPEVLEPKEKMKKFVGKSPSVPTSSLSKKQKKTKCGNTTPLKDVGRWRPADDLTLITAVLQTNDLNSVHIGCKFSCRFSLNEVQDRWYALLYDPVVSRLASFGMKQLPADIVLQIQSNTLWSKEEESLLANTSATTTAAVEYFQHLLDENPGTFHSYRTAKSIMQHWLQMKHYQLLDDQTVLALGSATSTFSDFEEQVKDSELMYPRDEILEHELSIADRRAKREIRQLEEEIPRWQAIVDTLNEAATAPTEFDSQTLAVLRGRLVRYLMRSREITVGRSTKDNTVDVDLSLEGPASKVSRKQAVIRLKPDGEYYVVNEGRRPIFIDGKPVLNDVKAKLHHNSTFEICGLHFVFLINKDYSLERKDHPDAQRTN